jgi:EmrB/QacA subfamily drug resistance transporter
VPAPTTPSDSAKTGSLIATLAVGSAMFMQFVDSTALATALPTLAREFDVSPVHLRLVLTTYMVVQALFLPASGWAADRFGPRRVFMAAMLVFLGGSVLCGLSQSLPQMIAARAVQGLGGAMMMPVGRIIVVGSSPREKLVQAMMWLSLPTTMGPIMGPPIAGLILQVADWPWIFFVNLPIGALSLLAVLRFVPRLQQPDPGAFDFRGFLIAGLSIAAVMTIVEASGASWKVQVGGALVAMPALALYVWHARRRVEAGARPILDLALLRNPTFRASVAGGSLVRLGMGGTPFLLALLLQVGLGWTALEAGSVTIFSAVGALLARPFGPAVIRRLGFRNMLVASAILIGLLGAAPGWFRAETPVAVMIGILVFTGFGRATQISAVNALGYADVPQASISAASTLSSVVQQITLALGVTVAGLTLQIAGGSVAALAPRDFILPFTVIGVVTLASLLVYLPMPANAGADISGRRI